MTGWYLLNLGIMKRKTIPFIFSNGDLNQLVFYIETQMISKIIENCCYSSLISIKPTHFLLFLFFTKHNDFITNNNISNPNFEEEYLYTAIAEK